MPLIEFELDGKLGLKNASGKVIVETKYDSFIHTTNAIIALHYVYDEDDDCDRINLTALDFSGDLVCDISDELNKQGVDNVLEIWQIKDSLIGFQFSDYDSLELTGVFDEKGQIIIAPDYDEIELISDNLLLCFHGEHYNEFDDLGFKNYGNKLFDLYGNRLEGESIEEYEEIAGGEMEFITTSGRKFITDRFGRVK